MAENANIRIIIDAIAEAAEEALDEVGDEILGMAGDAELAGGRLDEFSDEMNQATASGAILQEALDEVQDSEEKLTATSYLLQSAIDEVGDELLQASGKSAAASGSFSALSLSSQGASLSVGSFSSVLTLSLIPALLTLSTMLAPLAASFAVVGAAAASLAGAFGLIVGSGILAFGQERAQQNKEELQQVNQRIKQLQLLKEQTGSLTSAQQDQLETLKQKKKELGDATTATGALSNVMSDLKEEITPLIVEFGEQFVPLIADAVDAIPDLVENMFDAIGGTEQFRQALRDFGRVMFDVLPALVGIMFDLARDALPVLRDLATWLGDTGPGAASDMKASFEEIQPELMSLIDALIDMGPTLLEFGTVTANVVLPVITELVKAMDGFMETVLALPDPIRGVVVGFLAFLPVIVKLVSGLSTLLGWLGFNGITGALQYAVAWLMNAVGAAGGLSSILSTLAGYASTAASAIAGSTAALVAIGAAIGLAVVKLMDMFGVLDAVGNAGAAFSDFFSKDVVDSILTVASILSLGLIPLLGVLGGVIIGLVRGDISGAIDNAEQIFDRFAGAFQNVGSIIMSTAANLAKGVWTWLVGGFRSAGSAVWGVLTGLAQGFVDFFTNTLPQVIVRGVSFVIAFWESGMNRIYNLFRDVFQGIVNFGAQALETFLNTMIDHVNSWLSTIDDVADTVESVTGVNIGDVAELERVDIQSRELGGQRRETDVGTLAQRRQEQLNTTINGGIQVDVSNEQDLGQNPYRSSRTFGDQLRREIRNKQGT